MWTTIAGKDFTNYIPMETLNFQQSIGDPAPSFSFDVRDDGSNFTFHFGDEIIVWNEHAPPQGTITGHIVAATPAHNLVQLPDQSGSSGGKWTTTGALSIFTSFPGLFPNTVFSNTTYTNPNNFEYVTAITPSGYIHAGQQYMFSVYATISTPLVNAQAVVQMQFQDGAGNLLGSPVTSTFASTTNNAQQRVNISATAPSNAAYCQVWFGGQATTSGTNSGTINWGTPQLEPMYFTGQGINYPTPDCNIYQADCASMPDGTTSRAVRLFSGYIELPKREYIGPNRIWHIQCAGPGKLLENGLINATFTSQYDSQVLTTVINTYFAGQISIAAANTVSPSPLVQGAFLSSISYSDNTLREVLNGLSDASGYVFFLDPYYRLSYQPQISSNATFALSDSPDNMTSFSYYEYTYEEDGTQVKRRVKINGGKFLGNKQDPFNGDGSTKQFSLTYIPSHITSLTVGGTAQRVGVFGRDNSKLGTTYDVLLNKQAQYILFNSAPAIGTNNVVVTYAYEAPVTTQTTMQTSGVIIPAYALPLFDAKVNDTNIVDLATATTRGLAEIVKNGNPLVVINCKSQQFAPAGTAIFFTSTPDNIIKQPYVIQQVTGTMLGNNELLAPYNEFSYTLGAYQPTLHDHIRNAHKALNRSSTVANVTAAQQIDIVAMESVSYYDRVQATPQTQYAVGVYGTGRYGQCSYGGMTGTYGTARYGVSTIYG